MSENELRDLQGDEERRAAARSRVYQVFNASLEYPDASLCAEIREGKLAAALEEALAGVDPELARSVDTEALSDPGEEDALAIEYTRLFDVGSAGPPCPLYGGLYGGARMKTMEEAVRFYNYFGLKLSDEPRELPDHVTTELEFLHYLAYREAEALQRGEDAESFRRAQRDFVQRHPGRWIPKLVGRLDKQEPMRFFSALFRALEQFLAYEGRYLAKLAGSGPPPTADAGA